VTPNEGLRIVAEHLRISLLVKIDQYNFDLSALAMSARWRRGCICACGWGFTVLVRGRSLTRHSLYSLMDVQRSPNLRRSTFKATRSALSASTPR